MAKKCPECNGCMDILWIQELKRLFYCDFCYQYYDTHSGNLVKMDSKDVQLLAMKLKAEKEARKNVNSKETG